MQRPNRSGLGVARHRREDGSWVPSSSSAVWDWLNAIDFEMTSNPQASLSVVAYKPKTGKEADLLQLTKEHVPYLRSMGLATDRPQIICRAEDGTILEIFEWVEGGIEKAHANSGLAERWVRYAAVCDYVPLSTLAEANALFASFVPLN